MISKVAKVPYRFNKYRQHINQVTQKMGQGSLFRKENILEAILNNKYKERRLVSFKKEIKLLYVILHLCTKIVIDDILMAKFNDFIIHYDKMARMPYNIINRIPFVLNEINTGRYHKFSNGWRSAFGDLMSF